MLLFSTALSAVSIKKPESYELPTENLDETRKQLVAFADLSKSGDIKRVMAILPDGKVLEIAPGENSRIWISSKEEVSQQNGKDAIEWLHIVLIHILYPLSISTRFLRFRVSLEFFSISKYQV